MRDNDTAASTTGWARMPDGHWHHFDAVAYPACRAWFDWGATREPAPGGPACEECATEALTALRQSLASGLPVADAAELARRVLAACQGAPGLWEGGR